ncbi:MAG: FliI/YscN family ATPase [Desulfotignum sp.]|nr:FliI/YscN family ATPase [Desulfotignum sp.]
MPADTLTYDAFPPIDWEKYHKALASCPMVRLTGSILKVTGLVAEANGPRLSVGSICDIEDNQGGHIAAEVIGFNEKNIILMPFGEMGGVRPGSRTLAVSDTPDVPVGDAFLGRVVDGMGRPIDDKHALVAKTTYPVYGNVLNPMKRKVVHEVMDVGVSAINAMVTVGKGQRMAIMAGSGVGKSVLMGMIARNTAADVIVIGMIGERGREVREFIERSLGEEGLKKSVVVVATSDAPPLVRIRGAYTATALAEYFRDQGKDVLLIMDSITRFAMSMREVGLAVGEPPSAKGYTPSVFGRIPKLLERAGILEQGGSITGIYTVLVEGDDMNEPVADTVRSITDGHIVLSRTIAQKGHYPAVDIPASISRVMNDIVSLEHAQAARRLLRVLTAYREAEDLIRIGAYVDGSDPEIDFAKKVIKNVNAFLQQGIHEKVSFEKSLKQLKNFF